MCHHPHTHRAFAKRPDRSYLNSGKMSLPEKFGRFELQELINSGGMADLFLATDENNQPVAIRRMHKKGVFDFTARGRFVRGCEVLSRIHDHEFVIGYLEHGKVDGSHYLAMEYIEGNNLKLLAAEANPVLGEHIGHILIESAQALEHVHDCGFIHLDFKPENIVLSRNGALRLVDFDLSIPRPERPEKTKNNPGTPSYMSPEQLQRQPIDHRADIFAYGVTAYELLAGFKPFPGETPDDILRQHLDRSEFQTLRDLNPDIPAALEKVVLKCLETDMEKRYPFTSVLVRDLQATLYV
jgi:eukaryotic-like serine/threonine-protein kinase